MAKVIITTNSKGAKAIYDIIKYGNEVYDYLSLNMGLDEDEISDILGDIDVILEK